MPPKAAVVAINQLINDWGYELDQHNGKHIADVVTQDCIYLLGGIAKTGRAEIIKYYADREARLAATPEGVPIHRHALCNLRCHFRSAHEASITFSLIYLSTAGHPKKTDHADPASYADVRMDVRLEADGHWRIALFDSTQVFRRVLI